MEEHIDYSQLGIENPVVHDVSGTVFDSSRPFMCSECGKSYKRKDHLKIHSWTHKKKEVLCGQCGKGKIS